MANQYIKKGETTMKIMIPANKQDVWKLLATCEGISSWFPKGCEGVVEEGQELNFDWGDGNSDTFKVLSLKKNEVLETSWFNDGVVRYQIEGDNPCVFTILVTYPDSQKAKDDQLLELPGWAFFLSNLKSKIMSGTDLRDHTGNADWDQGFID